MQLTLIYPTIAVAACCAALTPLNAMADATARAYLGDERIPVQVQPPFVHGLIDATSQVGLATDAGYAYAYANLNSGILRVVGKSVYAPPFITTTDANTSISDSVTFSGAAGLTAFLDYSFEGAHGVISDAIPKAAFAQLFVNISTVGGSSSVYETLSAYGANCGVGTNCVVGTSTSRTGSLAFQIFSGAPTNFGISLNGFASIGNSFDFGNTAKLYLRVPDGVTYTSSSGSFLTAAAPITPVPEPATPLLLVAGFALLGLVARPRRAAATRVLVSHEAQPMRPKCWFPTCAASRTAPRQPFAAVGEGTDSRPAGFAEVHDESGSALPKESPCVTAASDA